MGLVMPRSLSVVRVGFHKSNVSKPLGVRGVLGPALISFYQLALPAPRPPPDSFDAEAAERGDVLFGGKYLKSL